MSKGKVCELCGNQLNLNGVGVPLYYRGKKIEICDECAATIDIKESESSSVSEKTEASNYFLELLAEDKPTELGSLYIKEIVLDEDVDVKKYRMM